MSQRRHSVVVISLFLITVTYAAVPEEEKLIQPQDAPNPSKYTDGVTGNGKGVGVANSKFVCVEEDTECTKDKLSYEAITHLHRLIDDDHNGNVDQSESDEFLRDELQYTDGFERHSLFHNNDKLISVDDLWRAWKFSKVYNWTVEEVVEWLQNEVELPQYSSIFVDNSVTGTFLPRMASSNTYMSTILGIKNPVHKQKLTLKAMDTVLFGPPPKRHNYLKDLALMVSLVFAAAGCLFGLAHHKYSQAQVRKMNRELEALQKAEDSLTDFQKKLQETERKQVSSVTQPRPNLQEDHGGREQMQEELAATQLALQQAETQLGQGWAPPGELQAWLQLTHELELQHYNAKRQAAERQFQSAKESCEKIKRRNKAIFGSLRMAHGNSLDVIDQHILDARVALEEVKQDLQERLQRWHTIERLCGFPVISNSGLSALHQILYCSKEGAGGSSRLTAGLSASGSMDEEDDLRSSGYSPMPPPIHSKPFARQMVVMGSTGSLSQLSRSGVGGVHPPPAPPHHVHRGSHDFDSPSLSFNTTSGPEISAHGDLLQDYPATMTHTLPRAHSSASDTNRARSTSIPSTLSSAHHRYLEVTQVAGGVRWWRSRPLHLCEQLGRQLVTGDAGQPDAQSAGQLAGQRQRR
ncbi:stromal interaction molecule homolog [Babylonia areolata]|uniref:stromal interaction molecule homolog n=1 Tax=Babylonia areolata TaxID=304850 RepID=UPI003FD4E873